MTQVDRPTQIVAGRLREERARLRLSAAKLADRCERLGAPELSRNVITAIEIDRRERVTVEELYVLAQALGVAPLDLLVPSVDQVTSVAPKVQLEGRTLLLDWIIGRELARARRRALLAELEGEDTNGR